MLTASVNVEEFNKKIIGYKTNFNLNLRLVIREQMRLLLGQIEMLLPPQKKKAGVNAIRKDISKQFVDEQWLSDKLTLKDEKLKERIQGYLKDCNYDAIKQIAKDTGILSQLNVKEFSESDIKRNGRGRIFQSGPKILPLDRKPLVDYRKKLEGHVGKLKSWCKNAYTVLGGKLPAWITNHSTASEFVDNTDDKNTPYIEVGSLLDFSTAVNSRYNVTQKAIDMRTRIIQTSIEKDVLNAAQRKFYSK